MGSFVTKFLSLGAAKKRREERNSSGEGVRRS